jgi:hypothetical protein
VWDWDRWCSYVVLKNYAEKENFVELTEKIEVKERTGRNADKRIEGVWMPLLAAADWVTWRLTAV